MVGPLDYGDAARTNPRNRQLRSRPGGHQHDLTQWIDTSDEWIVERTGIRERRWVQPGSGVGSSDLGAEAAKRALADSGVDGTDIDLVVFATISPDHDFPGNGPILQRKLGLKAPTLDVRQQCTGFLYGVSIADAYIRAGQARHVLVVAGEVQSTGLDLSNRGRDMSVHVRRRRRRGGDRAGERRQHDFVDAASTPTASTSKICGASFRRRRSVRGCRRRRWPRGATIRA